MNAQARADFEQADAELNKIYQVLLAKLPDAKSKQELKQTQRAWLASRDAKVTLAADQARGGSMVATIRYETLTELTQERIKQLKTKQDAASDKESASPPESSASSAAAPPASVQEPEGNQARSVSDTPRPAGAPSPNSISPDKKWEYSGGETATLIKAGTNEVA